LHRTEPPGNCVGSSASCEIPARREPTSDDIAENIHLTGSRASAPRDKTVPSLRVTEGVPPRQRQSRLDWIPAVSLVAAACVVTSVLGTLDSFGTGGTRSLARHGTDGDPTRQSIGTNGALRIAMPERDQDSPIPTGTGSPGTLRTERAGVGIPAPQSSTSIARPQANAAPSGASPRSSTSSTNPIWAEGAAGFGTTPPRPAEPVARPETNGATSAASPTPATTPTKPIWSVIDHRYRLAKSHQVPRGDHHGRARVAHARVHSDNVNSQQYWYENPPYPMDLPLPPLEPSPTLPPATPPTESAEAPPIVVTDPTLFKTPEPPLSPNGEQDPPAALNWFPQ